MYKFHFSIVLSLSLTILKKDNILIALFIKNVLDFLPKAIIKSIIITNVINVESI